MSRLIERSRQPRILLIEDNQADVLLLKLAIKRARWMVDLMTVSNAEKALEYLRDGAMAPDLILLDLNLPKMHGHQFLEIVKSDPTLCRIPAIVLTSSMTDTDIAKSYDLHANGHVAKPLSSEGYDLLISHLAGYGFESMPLCPNGHLKRNSAA